MPALDLKGKNFVFVGGSQGIGRAAALALAQHGASILIVGRNKDAGAAVVAQAQAAGATADFLSVDISTVSGIQTAADAIRAWKPELHGLTHSAITAFNQKTITGDGLELGFAVQYFARVMLNRLLMNHLAASGDGRIVHITANVSSQMADENLDDLQFEQRKWSVMKSVFGTHYLGFLHLQEAGKRYAKLPVSFMASCVASTKTQSAFDPKTPFIFRLLARFGTTPELAARNTVTLLTTAETSDLKSVILPTPKQYTPKPLNVDAADAAKLWEMTTKLALEKGLSL
ncbi:MAG: SDR family NAD(P)-dependent oxidoreductase [Anaerolineae bacterium]|nr:SDR family NAD(P)-dependent oxidoreductase [Anaerolineae bacterium]